MENLSEEQTNSQQPKSVPYRPDQNQGISQPQTGKIMFSCITRGLASNTSHLKIGVLVTLALFLTTAGVVF